MSRFAIQGSGANNLIVASNSTASSSEIALGNDLGIFGVRKPIIAALWTSSVRSKNLKKFRIVDKLRAIDVLDSPSPVSLAK